MRIPNKFKIAGLEIQVVNQPGLFRAERATGKIDYKNLKIYLDFDACAEGYLEQTFVHECVHWILYVMNNPLVKDEAFVDSFAQLAYQIIDSMRGGETHPYEPL